jgi:hypothetical protein
MTTIEAAKLELKSHPLFRKLQSVDSLKIFMSHHILCVWDFMLIVKSIQNHFCPSTPIWTPPEHSEPARLLNEIVLGEESDAFHDGRFLSHFEMYIEAMREVGCDPQPILKFLASLKLGQDATSALKDSALPEAAKLFSLQTLATLEKPLHQLVGIFFHARESLVPKMFRTLIAELQDSGLKCPSLRYYLDRHVHIDEENHGPMAERLLGLCCEGSDLKIREANLAALESLTARKMLWDQIQNYL